MDLRRRRFMAIDRNRGAGGIPAGTLSDSGCDRRGFARDSRTGHRARHQLRLAGDCGEFYSSRRPYGPRRRKRRGVHADYARSAWGNFSNGADARFEDGESTAESGTVHCSAAETRISSGAARRRFWTQRTLWTARAETFSGAPRWTRRASRARESETRTCTAGVSSEAAGASVHFAGRDTAETRRKLVRSIT